MIRRHRLHRALVPALAAAALAASTASAMVTRDTVAHHQLVPARVDAAAHAETMRAIGAAQMARNCG
jgi:hypothetical protein